MLSYFPIPSWIITAPGLQTKALHPGLQFSLIRLSKASAWFPVDRIRAAFFQNTVCLPHSAAAGGCKRNHCLTGEVIALQKRVDDGRSNIPPNRILNCSPSPVSLVNSGSNAMQKCVLCFLFPDFRIVPSHQFRLFSFYCQLRVFANTHIAL